MRRRDWTIIVMAFAIPMWVVCFLLPVSSFTLYCTPACDAVAGVTNCKNNGGSGECESTTSGCIHKQPAPPLWTQSCCCDGRRPRAMHMPF
jgi:hypothetical protein